MNPDPLERLASAGRDLSPSFSQTLHDRVMADVRCARRAPHPTRTDHRHHRWAWGAVAAAAVLTLWTGWPDRPDGARQDPPAIDRAALADVHHADNLLHDTLATLEAGRFAYLDRDGRRLVTFLMDQIPSLPAAQRPTDQTPPASSPQGT